MCGEATSGYYHHMIEVYEREALIIDLRERERRMMDSFGDCECSAAPLCPVFRLPGDLFAGGLPECVTLP